MRKYKTHKLAYEAGKRSGYSFKIEKHQVIDEDTVVIKSWAINSPLIEPDVEKQIEEIPYEIGESVRVIGTGKIGRVGISQEDWEWYVNKALMDNAIEDYSDASIIILYDDEGYDHGHISPLFLERVKR